MKPMLAIVEYASMRLMLVCAMAIDVAERPSTAATAPSACPASRTQRPPSATAEQPQHERERGELGRRADQQRHRRRRAVVHVGHPHVVRHGAELEGDRRRRRTPGRRRRIVRLPLPAEQRLRDARRCRASRSRRRSSTCRRAACPEASAPSTKYFIAASVARARVAVQRDHRVQRQRHAARGRGRA